ncbi:alkene reductase [Oecophyllibacter saccharovorans]|uniref:Alkene reductase n=1 Tax=Oecophyllibacter saccharovorans TaxID=2558360 RepID=A0A506ULR9_9PROT|nr:alkene reductase [Oecophyllibacter saccharovorans]QDH15432.1 alkene reductase [Oecophyllibacter saccharovorans]TPW34265.1 alkene reductase [Oecophyllibacter saccharovorans]TPW36452.1 alkene reductase [Oecophyllibacter saccharovorans]
MTTLFDPIQLGSIPCKNRIFMAPLTRARATKEAVPTPIMAEYYAQRADAGLIISEAVGISRQGLGWIYAPGIWNDEQVEAWKPITKAVHDKGGRIVCQLWHMGRMVASSVTGEQPVAPSVSTAPGYIHTYEGKQPYEEARALRLDEIPGLIADYANAARNAIKAGFDGVQLHAANGYLIDEFLRDGTNQRTDQYGGSPENRFRLLREVTEALIGAIGAEKVGVRLSPNGEIQGCIDSDPATVFVPAAKMLQDLGTAWLELRESDAEGSFPMAPRTNQPKLAPEIRKVFTNPLVLNQGYTFEEAEKTVESGLANAIAFGRLFIGNPDLVERFRKHLPLVESDSHTWYGAWNGAKGYTDYPDAQ